MLDVFPFIKCSANTSEGLKSQKIKNKKEERREK
jgi:hypothetical protein